MTRLVLSLALFCLVSSGTPGPNNIMLMSSGANFGLRRTLPHLLGVALGFGGMVMLLGLGVAQAFAAQPALRQGLAVVSALYMLWLAWKIAHAAAPDAPDAPGQGQGQEPGSARPLGFLQAAVFQWVNPKAWVMAVGALTLYAPLGPLAIGAAFAIITLPVAGLWVWAGQALGRWLAAPGRLRIFNWAMAGLLVLSLAPVLELLR